MHRLTTILTFGLFLAIFSSTVDASQTQPASVPRIVGHRGTCADRPESTLAALQRAIEVGADVVEIDVRTSKDGVLFLLHDGTLDRTTDGTGPASLNTVEELKRLDAGVSFDEKYRGERIPTLGEALRLCRDKVDVLLDLKEQGEAYAIAVARDVETHGDPARTILGVRSVEQARHFRRLLPHSRQLGFIPNAESVEAFAEAGVEIVRLWPRWLTADEGTALVERVRKSGAQLQLNGTDGTPQDVLPLLQHRPEMLLVDDPAALKATLQEAATYARQLGDLVGRVEIRSENVVVPWVAKAEAISFLNRDYHLLEFPEALREQPRVVFAGGEGDRVVLRFKKPTVVFAAFEYNTTGHWSFPEGHSPTTFGWNLVKKDGYRGTSNAIVDGKSNSADLYSRSFQPGEQLEGLPPWWLCVAVVDPETAKQVAGFSFDAPRLFPPFLYSEWATHLRPLCVPDFVSSDQWNDWQQQMRKRFQQQLVFPYEKPLAIAAFGTPVKRSGFSQQEYHVTSEGKRLFRFFKLSPDSSQRRPALLCFMGHGKVRQILEEPDSYQHACAARFAERGYVVFAMENVGMGPERDTHHELDRLLRLDGYGWYSLLFAHQQILLDHVFADPAVDTEKVGVTGVSTGGLLALSAIAMDPRVAAASVQGIFGSMRVSFIEDRDRHCQCGAIPGLLPDFDLPEMALLASPRPLHISNATEDGFGPAEARRQIERIASHYVASGGKKPAFSSLPGRHEYAFGPALDFFEGAIGARRPGGGYDDH